MFPDLENALFFAERMSDRDRDEYGADDPGREVWSVNVSGLHLHDDPDLSGDDDLQAEYPVQPLRSLYSDTVSPQTAYIRSRQSPKMSNNGPTAIRRDQQPISKYHGQLLLEVEAEVARRLQRGELAWFVDEFEPDANGNPVWSGYRVYYFTRRQVENAAAQAKQDRAGTVP